MAEISLELRDSAGVTISSSPATPTGYFFVPTESLPPKHYTMVAAAPHGWFLAPRLGKRASVRSDGVCNGGNDIVFEFQGFAVSGSLTLAPTCALASAFNAQLASSKSSKSSKESSKSSFGEILEQIKVSVVDTGSGSRIASVMTSQGAFEFPAVPPGSYKVVAGDTKVLFTHDTGLATIEVANGPVAVPAEAIVGSAFTLQGLVVAGSGAVPGVSVALFAPSGSEYGVRAAGECRPLLKDSGELSDEVISSMAPAQDGYDLMCTTSTNGEGSYSFGGLPCGDYLLAAHYETSLATFDVSPSALAVSLTGRSITHPPSSFSVSGFSVSGRVVDNKGRGVAGTSILLDGEVRATTSSDGYYVVPKVSEGSYEISASKVGMFFTSIADAALSPKAPKLPDLAVTGYSVCGSVSLSSRYTGVSRSVSLSTADSGVVESVVTDSKGAFCFEASPGTYQVAVSVKSKEAREGLVLDPPILSVVVDDAPVSDLAFVQSHIQVEGKVTCLASPCADGLGVALVENGEVVSTAKVSPEGVYVLDKVVPGSFALVLQNQATSWCFESAEGAVVVPVGATAPVEGPSFVQTGYALHTQSSHPVDLLLTNTRSSSSGTVEISIPKGSGTTCLAQPGVYAMAVADGGCVSIQLLSDYDTSSPRTVEVVATGLKIEGSIVVGDGVFGDNVSPPQELEVEVVVGGGSPVVKAAAVLVEEEMRYAFWVVGGLGERMEVRPVSETILFAPPSMTVEVGTKECPSPLAPFKGVKGVFLSGTTSPPMEGVSVSVEGVNGMVVSTGADGAFTLGPLREGEVHKVVGSKSGFFFKTLTDGESVTLKSVMLGSLSVRTSGVPGVLLSLSGDDFRSNVATGKDGSHVFTDLFPGEYYLTAQLKEYEFSPRASSVEIVEGHESVLDLSVTRIAWSGLGTVVSLAGKPVQGVAVDATDVEEGRVVASGTTDAGGRFRVRGLVPNTRYVMRLRDSQHEGGVALPESIEVVGKEENAVGLGFVVVAEPSEAVLSGSVVCEGVSVQGLSVVVTKTSSSSSKTVVLDGTGYFSFPALRPVVYGVRVVSDSGVVLFEDEVDLGQANREHPLYALSHMEIDLEESDYAVAALVAEDDEIGSASAYAMAVGSLGVVAFFYRGRVGKWWADVQFVPSED